jgi:hypothetical protein
MARPRVPVDTVQVRELRAIGLSWPAIARCLGIGLGTAYRAGQEAFQNNNTHKINKTPKSVVGRLSASDRPATKARGFWG